MKNSSISTHVMNANGRSYIHGETSHRTGIEATLSNETLIMVTNATPPSTEDLDQQGVAGGLLASLIPVMNDRSGLWISGEPLSRKAEFQKPPYHDSLPPLELADSYQHVGAQYPEQLHESYYSRIANGLLWPVFHGLLEQIGQYSHSDWQAYTRVNQYFADTTAELCSSGSSILIHDYQISLVPKMIREETGDDVNICFYLHIPFPACDTFRAIPWAKDILRGMLGADLIGFHTDNYCQNFMDCATRLLGVSCDYETGTIFFEERTIKVRAVPVSIDTQSIYRLQRNERIRAGAKKKRQHIGSPKILLGVDRLDYTKGIDRRIQAIDLLLEKHPEWREQIVFVQIAVPSRGTIQNYQAIRSKIESLTGHINGKWSTESWDPIKLICHSFGLEELVEWYLSADVCLVTPLRDGMNLVAKEYCAAQTHGQGVLVLSEFAGAAEELQAAILTNPLDTEGLCKSIVQALSMNPDEARRRMTAMNGIIAEKNAHHWVKSLLNNISDS